MYSAIRADTKILNFIRAFSENLLIKNHGKSRSILFELLAFYFRRISVLERSNFKLSNELNTNSFITVDECAFFSMHVYEDMKPLPEGWSILHSHSSADGYKGNVYARDLLTENAKVVFAHRGTVFTIAGDICNDIQLALGYVPSHVNTMYEHLFSEGYRKLDKIYDGHLDLIGKVSVISTGHSLGAILSDCFAAQGYSPCPSVTFENPGSKLIVEKVIKDILGYPPKQVLPKLNEVSQSCFAYQAGVNVINTCNEQLGKTFRIKNMDYDYQSAFFPVPSSYLLNPFYLMRNTFDQHRIEAIYKKITSPEFNVDEIINPTGFNEGYVDYLDEKNFRYWKTYLDIVWKQHTEIHDQYENEEIYIVRSLAKLNEIQKIAKEPVFGPPAEKLFSNSFVMFGQHQRETPEDQLLDDFVVVERKLREAKKADSSSYCAVM